MRQIELALNDAIPGRYPGRVEVLYGDEDASGSTAMRADVVIKRPPTQPGEAASATSAFDPAVLLEALEQLARRDGPHPVPPLGADGVAAFCRRLFDAAAAVVDGAQELEADSREIVPDLAFAAKLASAIRRFAIEGLPLSKRDPRLVIPAAARAFAVATSLRHG